MDLSGGGNRPIIIAIVTLDRAHGIRGKHVYRNHFGYYTMMSPEKQEKICAAVKASDVLFGLRPIFLQWEIK